MAMDNTAMRTANTVGDLIGETEWAPSATADLDFHTSRLIGPGCMDDGVGLGPGQARGGQAEQAVELGSAGQQATGHAVHAAGAT
jgi:hypothetical protein